MMLFLQRELWIYKAQAATICTSFLLFVFFTFLCAITLKDQHILGLYPIFIMVSGFLSGDILFDDDTKSGFLDTLHCTHHHFLAVTLQKFLVFWGCLGLPLSLLTICLVFLWHNIALSLPIIITVLLGSLIGFSIIMLCSALFTGAQKYKGLLFFIGLPLYFPTFLIQNTVICQETIMPIGNGLSILVGLGLFMVPLCLFVSSYCLKIATEE